MTNVKRRIVIYIIVGLVAVLAIGAMVLMSPGSQTESVAELLSLGERFLSELNYEAALVQFLRVIEIEPRNALGYYGTARAYIGLRQFDNAIDILRRGVEMTGDGQLQVLLNELLGEASSTGIAATPAVQGELTPEDRFAAGIEEIIFQGQESIELFDYREITFYGLSLPEVFAMNLGELQAFAQGQGYLFSESFNPNPDISMSGHRPLPRGASPLLTWTLFAVTRSGDPDIIGSFSYGSTRIPHPRRTRVDPRGINIVDIGLDINGIVMGDTAAQALYKIGFVNAGQMADFLRPYLDVPIEESEFAMHHRVWSGEIDGYRVDLTLNPGGRQYTDFWQINFHPVSRDFWVSFHIYGDGYLNNISVFDSRR